MGLKLNTASSGSVTLEPANTASNYTLTVPAQTGTVALTADIPASYTNSNVLTLFNASGSAPVYACRAWVNFNGTGTVAIRASGNVSSITDNGTGDYTVNFTTAMPDVNYSIHATGQRNGAGASSLVCGVQPSATYQPTVSSCQIRTPNDNGTAEDAPAVFVAIFR